MSQTIPSTTPQADFDTYEGQIKAGRMNGFGKLTYRDGTVVEGVWVEN